MDSDMHPDEIAAAAAAERDDPAAVARGWLLAVSDGTLCTSAVQRGIEGYPYGSVVPYALTATGHPVVLIADIAAHTANLRRDPRASLFIRQPETAGDPQAGWRLTVLGEMERLSDSEASEELEARYLERVTGAARYRETHGFAFWRMSNIVKARYIGGFGKICWLDGAALLRDPNAEIGEVAPGAIAHMNEDHVSSMIEMCTGLYGFTPSDARMVSLDRAGFLVRTENPGRLVHFSFGREIGPSDLRPAVISVLQRARATAARPARQA